MIVDYGAQADFYVGNLVEIRTIIRSRSKADVLTLSFLASSILLVEELTKLSDILLHKHTVEALIALCNLDEALPRQCARYGLTAGDLFEKRSIPMRFIAGTPEASRYSRFGFLRNRRMTIRSIVLPLHSAIWSFCSFADCSARVLRPRC